MSERLNDGMATDYGFGLVVNHYRGLKTVGHSGADAGYRADVVRFPDQDLAIAVFCNLSTIAPGVLTRSTLHAVV
ncbi:MAG: serine hydrolase [Proteobacteria bacterium]|nr:serine hydrolase [Pseudomonadota bacterium]